MKLLEELKVGLAGLVLLAGLDFMWLSLFAKRAFAERLGDAMRSGSPSWLAVVGVYLLLVIGIVSFVLIPSVEKQQPIYALGMGALFGLTVYGIYDLTNLSLLKDYDWTLALADMAWGTSLCAVVSLTLFYVHRLVR